MKSVRLYVNFRSTSTYLTQYLSRYVAGPGNHLLRIHSQLVENLFSLVKATFRGIITRRNRFLVSKKTSAVCGEALNGRKDLAESLSTGVDKDLVTVKKVTQLFGCESDVQNKHLWDLFGWD